MIGCGCAKENVKIDSNYIRMELNIKELAGNARNNLKATLLSVSENIWRTPLTRAESIVILQNSIVYKEESASVVLPELKDDSQEIMYYESAFLNVEPDYVWQLGLNSSIQSIKICRSGSVLINNKHLLNLDFGCTAGLLDSPIKPNKLKYKLVIAPWSHFWGAYYDYVIYVVAKLCRIEKVYGKEIWKETKVCYPLLKKKFEQEFLAKLGIPSSNVIDTAQNWITEIEADCIIAGNNQESWTPSLSDMQLLKERFCSDRPEIKTKKRLYISRAGRRKVINEDEVREVLRTYNFEIIEDVARGLDEQIDLFRSASAIVTPHGAALTNMLWCDEGTTIVELFNQGYMPNYYYYMSIALGHPYSCLIEYDANKPKTHWSNTADDIQVNIPDLKRKLEQLFG